MTTLKAILSLALLGLCFSEAFGYPDTTGYYMTSDEDTTATQPTSTVAAVTSEADSATENAIVKAEKCGPGAAEVARPTGSCYISETEAAKLSAQLGIWAKVLTIRTGESEDDEVEAAAPEEKYQLQSTTDSEMTFCSEYRIERLEQDLASLVQRVWKMTTSLEDATDEQVDQFDEDRVVLIERLSELQVYTTRSSGLMTSITFKAQLDLLDANLDNIPLLFPKSISRIVRQILEPGKTTAELVAFAEQKPEAMSAALPRLMTAKYAGNLRNFDSAFQLVKSLPSVEQQVEGYAALYHQMRNSSHLETWEVSKLAIQFYQTPPLSASASETVQAQLTQLSQEMEPLKPYSTNRTQSCSFTSVKYSTRLFTTGSSSNWPEYAVVYSSSSLDNKLRLQPQDGGLTFEIHSGSSLLYSTSSNYDGYKRYVYEADEMFNVPSGAWKNWILVPANGGKNFKILNAQNNEVMYVDTATIKGYNGVFLKRTGGSVSMAANADLWSLECSTL